MMRSWNLAPISSVLVFERNYLFSAARYWSTPESGRHSATSSLPQHNHSNSYKLPPVFTAGLAHGLVSLPPDDLAYVAPLFANVGGHTDLIYLSLACFQKVADYNPI